MITILSKKKSKAEKSTSSYGDYQQFQTKSSVHTGTDKPLLGLNLAGARRLSTNGEGSRGTAGSIPSSDTNAVCRYSKVIITIIKLLHLNNPTEQSMSKRLGDLFATQQSEFSQ